MKLCYHFIVWNLWLKHQKNLFWVDHKWLCKSNFQVFSWPPFYSQVRELVPLQKCLEATVHPCCMCGVLSVCPSFWGGLFQQMTRILGNFIVFTVIVMHFHAQKKSWYNLFYYLQTDGRQQKKFYWRHLPRRDISFKGISGPWLSTICYLLSYEANTENQNCWC